MFSSPLSSSKLTTIINVHHHHRPSFTTTLRLPPLSTITHHHHHHHLRSISHFQIKSSQNFHRQAFSNDNRSYVSASHPWPELSEFISNNNNNNAEDGFKDEIVSNESLSIEFLDYVCLCLGFAHHNPHILRRLPKDDIEVLVNNGGPSLFKNAIETEKRMRSFLKGDESSEATTVDVMKYILSYASNPIIYPERKIDDAIESSARNLLRKMANFNGRVEALNMPATEKSIGTYENEQTPSSLRLNGAMKRGDWICRKCSFMNIATNTKCHECKELRPQRQLTGSEWDCPERPGEVPLPAGQVKTSPTPNGSDSGYAPFVPLPADMFAKKSENMKIDNPEKSTTKFESRIVDDTEEEKPERWFNKVGELQDLTDLKTDIADDDFPEIMPMRKGENRFVVSKKKDRSSSSTYKRQQSIEQASNNTTNFVPFVPFPPDYFAKKDDNHQSANTNSSHTNDMNLGKETRDTELDRSENRPETSNGKRVIPKNQNSTNSNHVSRESSSKATNDVNLMKQRPATSNGEQVKPENLNVRNGWEGPGSSLEGSAVKETDPLDMSEEAKAERWFRRVAQIKDISELSQIPDEDFPSIMPMRKGVNRFVVSKRKTPLERRLASPPYKKDIRTVSSEPTKKEGDGS
ncbi:zinc finger protein VAR3, chloroplastic-like protein [Tanacetum coccineum]|uniref:Zinc finger protein VAR3, chloroplastic-like protein n=1 Tax=Tanacetum coccineum TaxID=301880 RepID=A0ABQ5FKB6_9ASTR